MKDIFILGAGGVGRETVQLIEAINRVNKEWNIIGFLDDNAELRGKMLGNYKVVGSCAEINKYGKEVYTVCTISNPAIKKRVIDKINNSNVSYANLIHPTAVVSDNIEFGKGIIIQAYCVLTTDIVIGDHVQLNPQCGIGHDSVIGAYSSLYWNVNISGNVKVGEGCILGTKATVLQGLKIGDGAIVGANATVIRDVPSDCTVVGTPARLIKQKAKSC